MKESLIYKGYWYLPGGNTHKVPGTLTYLPGQNIELKLLGTLRENISFADLFNNEEFPVIYGETSAGKQITLLNCFSRAGVHGGCDFPVITCDCQYLLEGIHLEEQIREIFHSITVRIPQLTAWAHPGALRFSIADDQEGNQEFMFAFNSSIVKKKICEVLIEKDTLLSLRSGIDYSSSYFLLHPQIEQYTYLVIGTTKEKRSFEELLGKAHLFIQFLSLATLQIPVPTEISLFRNDPFPCAEPGKMPERAIKLYYGSGPAANHPQEGNPARDHYLFTYEQIKDSFEGIMHKWFDWRERIAPIRGHLIKSIGPKRYFDSTDFLIVIQALEGYYLRFIACRDYHIPLRTALNRLLSKFGDIDKIKSAGIDIEAAVDSRHYYSHFMEREDKPKTLDGIPLYELTKKLKLLLLCSLLHLTGLDNGQINDILNKSANSLTDL